MGKEFDIPERLRNRLLRHKEWATYYLCYGGFDLIEMLMVDSIDMIHNIPFDDDITHCDFSLFYSWDNISKPVHEWARNYNTVVLVLLSIQPKIEERFTFDVEKLVIKYVDNYFKDDANFFIGMGHADILLLVRGNCFDQILSRVSALRKNLNVGDLFNGDSIPYDTKLPIFICSTSFPLINNPHFQKSQNFSKLHGKLLPIVNIDCCPAYEKYIASQKPSSCIIARDIYGKYDIFLAWQEPIDLSIFARELTNFRDTIGSVDGIRSTSTSIVGLEDLTPPPGSGHDVPPYADHSPPPIDFLFENIVAKANKVRYPEDVARLFDFLGRFRNYLVRPESSSYFRDMVGIIHSINFVLDQLILVQDHKTYGLRIYLSQLLDLASHGIYQRFSHLESHYEFRTRVPFPFLCDINAFIGAASYAPCFILSKFFNHKTISDIWNGFVLFGQSYSYQYFPQGNILSYQASALHHPIEDWWGISHEVAHAIYWLSLFQEIIPKDIKEDIDYLDRNVGFWPDIEEIYANWFDYRYIFAGDKSLYFPLIWKSWLRWDRVWKFKTQYLVRSLSTFISDDNKHFYEAQLRGPIQTLDYLKAKMNEMIGVILPLVPRFKELLDDISDDDYNEIYDVVCRLEDFLSYLENRYFDIATYSRLNPEYPNEMLERHITEINNGLIITEDIPNPCRLLQKLCLNYLSSKTNPSIKTSAAMVLTFWNAYVKNYLG